MVVTTREHKEKTIVGPLIGVILVITIIAAFAVVILRQTAAQEQKEELNAQAVQQAEQAQQEQAQERLPAPEARCLLKGQLQGQVRPLLMAPLRLKAKGQQPESKLRRRLRLS